LCLFSIMDEIQAQTGTYVEGFGDEVIECFVALGVVTATFYIMYSCFFARPHHIIHPESQKHVSETRSRLGLTPSGSPTHSDQEVETEAASSHAGSSRQYYNDRKCPICLQDARFAVETNCGHLFCGQCIVTYWLFGNWLGAVQCPVCRQTVSLLLRDFPANIDGGEEIERSIRDYNRRFSGQPRPIMDYLWDLPALLRHLLREFFSVGGLVIMFRARIVLCVIAIIVYLISPLDILPEAVLGLLGLLDDVFVLLLVLVYMTIIYRQVVAQRE